MSQTDTTLLNRLIKGVGANAYGQVLVIIIQLVGVPILLRYWGAQLYGEWLILAAIPSYLSMVDLGFSLSAANDMTARVARGDRDGTLAIFQSLSVLVYVLIFVGIILSTLLFANLSVDRWMHLTAISISDSRWILWLLASSVLIQIADGVNHAGFRAHGEYAFHSFFNSTTLLVQQSATWMAALIGYGPVLAAFLMLIVRILNTLLMTILLFRRHKTLKPGLQYASREQLRTLVKPALANMAMPLAQGLNVQGMVLVVGAILGPLAVVTFSTLRTLTRFAYQMVLSISFAFEPEMASAWGRDDKGMLLRLYINNLRLGFWLALSAVASLFFLGDWIVRVWTHGKVLMDTALFNWLLVSALVSVMWFGGLNLLKAGNHHLRAAFWYVFASLAAVLLAAWLLRNTGRLPFAGLALVVMDGLMMIYVFRSAAAFIGQKAGYVLRSMFDLRSLVHEIFVIVQRKSKSREVR